MYIVVVQAHSIQYIMHPVKKFQLQKKQVFFKMGHFNLPMYEGDLIHFKDACIALSYQVACIVTDSQSIE